MPLSRQMTTIPSVLKWLGLFVVGCGVVWVYQAYGLGDLLTLDTLKASRQALMDYYQAHSLWMAVAYFTVYVVATALSIPGAVILTLAGGVIFGFGAGLLLVSFASSIGALLAFLVARYLLHDTVQSRFTKQLTPINNGLEKDGIFYLLSLRLVPLFPFFLINLLMGLTSISAWRFYWVSQVGMLAGTAVYVNAGTQLGDIHQLRDILSPDLLISFVLLGIFPLMAKGLINLFARKKVYQGWTQPKTFDRNLIVIGAGAGGLVTSYIGAVVKAKVTLIEHHKMGGDCLNYGCVPSKALIRSAKAAKECRQADNYGVSVSVPQVDFAKVMSRIQQVIGAIEPHDSVERYTQLGVEVLVGTATIISPWEVEVMTGDKRQTLTTRNIVIASGAAPFIPPIKGLTGEMCLTSDNLWQLTALPQHLLIMGGGPIGCEMAQAFCRLGSQVTLVEMAPRLLMREDPEVSDLVADALRQEGVVLMLGHEVIECQALATNQQIHIRQGEEVLTVACDQLLCAVGRKPRVAGFGLETLGIPLAPGGTIQVNEYLQTHYPNIYAVGDVAGPYQLTHAAAHQAWYAAVNALFGVFKRFKVDYSVIPWTTFTDPEVARVGLSETEAQAQGIAYEVSRYALDDLDRAITDGNARGFIKVLTVPSKDTILGVTIVGEQAGELLAEYVLAMKQGLGLNKILGTIHSYPTLAEANKYAAGVWKQAHTPHRLLCWVERYHQWRRG